MASYFLQFTECATKALFSCSRAIMQKRLGSTVSGGNWEDTACIRAKSLQSCLTLRDRMDCSPTRFLCA